MVEGRRVAPGHAEETVAARVRLERERRGWSFGEVAQRMTAVGCSMTSSTPYKIETGRRKTTVNELAGFASIFGLSLEALLTMTELSGEVRAQQLAADMTEPWGEVVEQSLTVWGLFRALGEVAPEQRVDPRPALLELIDALRDEPVEEVMRPLYRTLRDVIDVLARVHLGLERDVTGEPGMIEDEEGGRVEHRATS